MDSFFTIAVYHINAIVKVDAQMYFAVQKPWPKARGGLCSKEFNLTQEKSGLCLQLHRVGNLQALDVMPDRNVFIWGLVPSG